MQSYDLILSFCGIIAGVLSSVAGGGGLITIPAMIGAGLTPAIAVASNTAALVPGNLSATFTERAVLPPFDRRLLALLFISLLSSTAGAALLFITPEHVYASLVPILLGTATLLFAYSGRIGEWLKSASRRATESKSVPFVAFPLLIPASVYNGYFGVGSAVVLLSVLSISFSGNYRLANALKNLFSGLNALAASVYFFLTGALDWRVTLIVMAGAIFGGIAGVRLAQRIPRAPMRVIVIIVGIALSTFYAFRYWV
jgi:uncharacterized membrane protein YfcA